jgi:hypothetical protein
MPPEPIYKGFTRPHLESSFGVRFQGQSVVVPYRDRSGKLYREKEFSLGGKARCWLGESKPQVPYGLETLSYSTGTSCDPSHGATAFLTEGESCAWTLRATYPRNAVLGLPGASSWSQEWCSFLTGFPVIYLSFDGDAAGRELVEAVWPDLPWARRVKLPDGLDTRDLIQLHGGVERYERLLDDADYIAGCTRSILETAKGVGGRARVAA